MRAAFADIAGIETRYFYKGSEGVPVLLIHGAGVSGASWLRNIDSLSSSFQVCAPDLLGHGLTPSGDYREGPPHPQLLDHLAALVDHLGWSEFHVVGSSFGALLSALLYLRMPDRIKKMVAISSGSFVNTDEELAISLKESYANGSSAIMNPSLETCRHRMERIFYTAEAVPPELIFMQLSEYAVPWAREAYDRRMRGLMDIDACRPYRVLERLEELRLPVLLLWGLNDKRAVYAQAQKARDRIPDARLIAFDRCKHHPHIEHADKFNEVTQRFLLGETLDAYPDVVSGA